MHEAITENANMAFFFHQLKEMQKQRIQQITNNNTSTGSHANGYQFPFLAFAFEGAQKETTTKL